MWDRIIEKRNEGGFTLIELLIVIIILAILAAIVVFAVGTTGSNAVAASCNADAKTFETALEAYKAEVGDYPGSKALSTNGQANYSDGQTWTAAIAAGTFGLEGNNGTEANPTTAATTPAATWTSPLNQASIGTFLRELPSGPNKQHYRIWTDGLGGVFAIGPSTTNAPPGAGTLVNTNNFDLTPTICNSFQ